MDRLVTILLCLALNASAATYYVDGTNGAASDANVGSEVSPWLTIQRASQTASNAGDLVIIKPACYNEWFTNLYSGSAGSPITYTGVRGGAGEWLTIIDPSTSISNGWVAAAEFGAGVYKITNTFVTRELSITNQRVMGIYTLGTIDTSIYPSAGITDGYEFLGLAEDVDVELANAGWVTNWWASFGALWSATNNITYLRFADGRDPNGIDIRAAPNREAQPFISEVQRPAISVGAQSHVVFSNLWIRNAFTGIKLNAGANNITIASNYISGGEFRVLLKDESIGSAPTGPYQNLIYGNTLVGNYFGTTNTGAYDGIDDQVHFQRDNIYSFSKTLFSPDDSAFEEMIHVEYAGNSNTITANTCTRGIGVGITVNGYCGNPSVTLSNTVVSSNTFMGFPSIGINVGQMQFASRYHDNLIEDCNANVRFPRIYVSGQDTNRVVDIYRNRSYQPASAGDHYFFHVVAGQPGYIPTVWIYHNSHSGGRSGFYCTGLETLGTISNFFFINNIFDDDFVIDNSEARTNANWIGAFDYNVIYPALAEARAWMGTHNITNSAAEWTNEEGMSFALASGSLAIGAALDTSSTFWTTNSALPDTATKVGAAWDIGAMEYVPTRGTSANFGASKVYY